MAKTYGLTRRQFTRAAGRTALLGAAATLFPAPFVKSADPVVHRRAPPMQPHRAA